MYPSLFHLEENAPENCYLSHLLTRNTYVHVSIDRTRIHVPALPCDPFFTHEEAKTEKAIEYPATAKTRGRATPEELMQAEFFALGTYTHVKYTENTSAHTPLPRPIQQSYHPAPSFVMKLLIVRVAAEC